MTRLFKHYHPPGTPPGTLTREERPTEQPPRISIVSYDREHFEETEDATPDQCEGILSKPATTWVHVSGHSPVAQLHALGRHLQLHSLALEDVVNTVQRPKLEAFDEQLFVIMNLPVLEHGTLRPEQFSLFVMENCIVSFHDGSPDFLAPVYKRLRSAASLLRKNGRDALLYALLDLVIDHGFPVMEAVGDAIEQLEEDILQNPDAQCLEDMHRIRRELVGLRRTLWPQREVLSRLIADSDMGISDSTKIYLRDCYDHTIQIMDIIESCRDTVASLLDIYLSRVSNRLNETMRVLTVISTIFIPPTFLASIYGMNFDRDASPWNMPELGWHYGYPMVWGMMIATIIGMLFYFRRRNWF